MSHDKMTQESIQWRRSLGITQKLKTQKRTSETDFQVQWEKEGNRKYPSPATYQSKVKGRLKHTSIEFKNVPLLKILLKMRA